MVFGFALETGFAIFRLGAVARAGLRVLALAFLLTTRLAFMTFFGEIFFLVDFATRVVAFGGLVFTRDFTPTVFAFARAAGLTVLALVRTVGFDDFAFAPIGRLVAFAFARTDGLVTFTLVRTAGKVELFNFLALTLLRPLPFAFVALRAGALAEGERLAIGFGRADLPDNARLFAEVVEGLRREAELD
jgi:hypothetical protein